MTPDKVTMGQANSPNPNQADQKIDSDHPNENSEIGQRQPPQPQQRDRPDANRPAVDVPVGRDEANDFDEDRIESDGKHGD